MYANVRFAHHHSYDPPLAMSVVDALAQHDSEATAAECDAAPVSKVDATNFELLRVIGKGGYGKVVTLLSLPHCVRCSKCARKMALMLDRSLR